MAARKRRMNLSLERLEIRTLLSAPEPNNTLAQAYTPPSNIYLEQNYFDTDSVSTSTDGDDYRKFYNLYGASNLYAVLNGMSSDADLYIYDQNGNYLASSTAGGNTSEVINVSLAGNQYFYVRVRAFTGATNYGLLLYNDYAGPSLGTARDIGTAWGQGSDKYWNFNKLGSEDYLDYRDNVDYVKFRMEAPGTVNLRMKDFTYSGGLVAQMQLLDGFGNVMNTTSGTVGDGLNINYVTLNSGTYYVRFTQISGSDPYTFRIVSDYAGDFAGTARNLGDLTNTSRQLYDMVGGPFGLASYEDAMDLYKFTLSQTATVDFRLAIAQGLTPPTFDANLQLARDTNGDGFIQSGEIIVQSVNSGDDSFSRTLNAGTYYVVVVQNGAYTSYQLDLDSDLDSVPSDPAAYKNMTKAVNLGSLVGENSFEGGFGISAGDFADYYKFTLPFAATLDLGAFNNSYFSRDTTNPWMTIIKDTNGNGIYDTGEDIASDSGSLVASLSAGAYYLGLFGTGQQMAYYGRAVPDFAGNTLPAARVMAAVTNTTGTSTQTFNDYIEQDFGPGSDIDDYYQFNLPDVYNVKLNTTGVSGEDLSLALIRDVNNNGIVDAGDIMATSDALNSPTESINRNLFAGRYFVRVQGINGATNYKLTATFGATTDPDDTINEVKNLASNALALGSFVDGDLSTLHDVDLYKITVTAGQRVSFDVDSRGGSNIDTFLRVFKANGSELAVNNDGAAPGEASQKFSYLEYTFATAGTYYVGVSQNPNKSYNPLTGLGDVFGGKNGLYRLTLNNLGKASPTILRVNAGGPVYIDAGGRNFETDGGFTGGTKSNTAFAVAGTTEDALFYANRSGANFSYAHAIANGTYKLSLYFAEGQFTAVGQRKFNVFAEGSQILTNFDIVQAAGGAKKAVVKTFTVNVTDGQINLSFAGVVGNALVSAISLEKV